MAGFDQRGQHVNYQYNADGNINFGAVQSNIELVNELEKLKGELSKAATAHAIAEDVRIDTDYQLTKAIQQAKQPTPNKKSILNHLSDAKALIEGISAAGGMVTALIQASQLVMRLL